MNTHSQRIVKCKWMNPGQKAENEVSKLVHSWIEGPFKHMKIHVHSRILYRVWWGSSSFIVLRKWKKEWASTHNPRSNIAWECCIQWQFQALVTGNPTKKRIKIAPQKDQISIFCKNAYLHIMSFISTKFHEIRLSGFSRVVLTNCFSSIYDCRRISKFKNGVFPIIKMESKSPVDMHIYTLCPSLLQSFRKFCWEVSEELR